MPRKKTTAEFIEQARAVHGDKYDYSRAEYKKWNEKVIISCHTHGQFLQSPDSHLNGGGCAKCARENCRILKRKTTEEYVLDLNGVAPEFELVDTRGYMGSGTKVLHLHKKCGHIWDVSPNSILRRSGCPSCNKKNRVSPRKKSHSEFIKEVESLIPGAKILSKYKGNKTNVLIDFGCGHGPMKATPNNILRGTRCRECRRELTRSRFVKPHVEFEKEMKSQYPDISILGKYVNSKTKILVDFNCGHGIHKVTPNHLLKGVGCPRCHSSIGERRVRRFMVQEGIMAWEQYVFSECVNKSPLRFDFFLPNWRICVEYQGKQHFRTLDNNFFGGEKALKERQERDQIKRDFCKKSGIILVEIPYNDERIAQRILGAIAKRKREREQNPIQEQMISRNWGSDWVFGEQARLF